MKGCYKFLLTHMNILDYKNLWYVFFPIFCFHGKYIGFTGGKKEDRVQNDGGTPHVVTCNLTKRQPTIFLQLHKGITIIIMHNCGGSCVPQRSEGD